VNQEVEKIFKDREENFFPKDDKFFEKVKCELNPGKKVYWYYKEDKEFADEHDFNIKIDPGFSGIIVPFPGETLNSNDYTTLEEDQCMIVVTEYPAQKEYCECGWISLFRLLDQDGLVEVFDNQN
jgi:hypothetical protein